MAVDVIGLVVVVTEEDVNFLAVGVLAGVVFACEVTVEGSTDVVVVLAKIVELGVFEDDNVVVVVENVVGLAAFVLLVGGVVSIVVVVENVVGLAVVVLVVVDVVSVVVVVVEVVEGAVDDVVTASVVVLGLVAVVDNEDTVVCNEVNACVEKGAFVEITVVLIAVVGSTMSICLGFPGHV